MTDSTVRELPGAITFDFDAAERPADEIKPPFVTVVRGREITMKDPADIDWRDLLLMEDPTQFLRYALSKEDREHLQATPAEGWRFNQLMEAYENHYDLEDKIRQARQQQRLRGV